MVLSRNFSRNDMHVYIHIYIYIFIVHCPGFSRKSVRNEKKKNLNNFSPGFVRVENRFGQSSVLRLRVKRESNGNSRQLGFENCAVTVAPFRRSVRDVSIVHRLRGRTEVDKSVRDEFRVVPCDVVFGSCSLLVREATIKKTKKKKKRSNGYSAAKQKRFSPTLAARQL